MYTDWPVSWRTHQHYERQPWPKKTEATIEAKRLWPEDDQRDAGSSTEEASPDDQPKADEELEGVWEDLRRKTNT